MILLDMDGVLCDFVKAACALHNQPVESVDCWDFNKKWGITSEQLWAPIHDAGPEWWADLEPYPWFDELIGAVEAVDPKFAICTTPSQSPDSCAGKLEWLHRHMGAGFKRYFMTCDKSPLAGKGRLLIDDGDHNCTAFHENGGAFICVPQPWNSNARFIDRRMEHVTEYLNHYMGASDRMRDTLPSSAAKRDEYPMADGLLYYFPAALAEVARVSKAGNDQHNPGEPLHWSRGKSMDHANKIIRHLIDAGNVDSDGTRHTAKVAWRALALLQEEMERDTGAPLPRNARVVGVEE